MLRCTYDSSYLLRNTIRALLALQHLPQRVTRHPSCEEMYYRDHQDDDVQHPMHVISRVLPGAHVCIVVHKGYLFYPIMYTIMHPNTPHMHTCRPRPEEGILRDQS
jgi:hypothetical protein